MLKKFLAIIINFKYRGKRMFATFESKVIAGILDFRLISASRISL